MSSIGPRPRLRFPVTLCLGAFLLANASLRAQETCVSAEVLDALLGASDLETGVFVGSLPAGIEGELPLPAGARVVGGMNRDGHLVVVAHVAGEASTVKREIEALLGQSGWKIREDQPFQQGGFQRSATLVQPELYCGPHGAMAHYGVHPRKEGGSVLRISRTPKIPGMGGPCTAKGVPRHLREQGPMPTLVPPSEMGFPRGSRSCGGPGERSSSTTIITDDPPAAILVAFSDQLAAQGWQLDSELVGETMGAQTWSLVDAEGVSWRGILFTATLSEDTRDLSFSITARQE